MITKLDSSVAEFVKHVEPELLKEATLNSMLMSLSARYIGKDVTTLARGLNDSGRLLVAGIQTSPEYALVMSPATAEAAREFALGLAAAGVNLPGVSAPVPAVEAFAGTWSEIRKQSSVLRLTLRLFKLTELIPPPVPSGFFRVAVVADEALIFKWLREFHQEAVPHDPRLSDDQLLADIRDGTAKAQYFIWEDAGEAACLLGSKRETLTERWIAPVYTPPAFRGRGYGAALTAAVSAQILATGKMGMLFTDQSNPISNRVYQKIGYTAVADFKHFVFG